MPKDVNTVALCCGNCRHWDRLPDVEQVPGDDIGGECLLNPPTVLGFDEEGALLQADPYKQFQSRCGQHDYQEH